MTQLSSEKKANMRWRDMMLYLLIAVTLVGAEVIGLIRDWPRPSLRAAVGLFSTIILAVYLIKIFKTKLRSVEFWLLLTMLLLVHVLWIVLVPFLFVMVGLGIELLVFGMFLQHFLRVR